MPSPSSLSADSTESGATVRERAGFRPPRVTATDHSLSEEPNKVTVTEAVVKLNVEGKLLMSVAEGNGPVNALDLALRKDLGKYSIEIADLVLVDFKVRILDGGTGAVTRVLVESRDGTGERWYTIGVSPNIIDASFEALYESITYKLMKTRTAAAAPASKLSPPGPGG